MATQTEINTIVIRSVESYLEDIDMRISPYKVQPIYIFGLIKSMGQFAGFKLEDKDVTKIFRSISSTVLRYVNTFIACTNDDLIWHVKNRQRQTSRKSFKAEINETEKEIKQCKEELVDLKKAKVVLMELRKKNLKTKPRKKK